MKLITANKLHRLFNNGINPLFAQKIDKTRVLTTMEQVKANTNAENIASATVVKELNKNLGHGQISFEVIDGEPYVKVGADSPRPFRKAQVVSRNLQWQFIENGTIQTKTADLSSVSGYKNLTVDDIFLDIKYAQIGYSGCSITIANKTYDAEKGILSCSFTVTNDNLPTYRDCYLRFDLICI